MVNFHNLTFACSYSHVKSHQDDNMAYRYLSRPYQINCIMDDHTKKVIYGIEGLHLSAQKIFPLELVTIFVGNENMTFNNSLQLWVHQQLEK